MPSGPEPVHIVGLDRTVCGDEGKVLGECRGDEEATVSGFGSFCNRLKRALGFRAAGPSLVVGQAELETLAVQGALDQLGQIALRILLGTIIVHLTRHARLR